MSSDSFPDIQCPLCGATMSYNNWCIEEHGAYACQNLECGIWILTEEEGGRLKTGFLEKISRRTPPPATAEVLRECERRVNEGWLEIADLIMRAVVEWSENPEGGENA